MVNSTLTKNMFTLWASKSLPSEIKCSISFTVFGTKIRCFKFSWAVASWEWRVVTVFKSNIECTRCKASMKKLKQNRKYFLPSKFESNPGRAWKSFSISLKLKNFLNNLKYNLCYELFWLIAIGQTRPSTIKLSFFLPCLNVFQLSYCPVQFFKASFNFIQLTLHCCLQHCFDAGFFTWFICP